MADGGDREEGGPGMCERLSDDGRRGGWLRAAWGRLRGRPAPAAPGPVDWSEAERSWLRRRDEGLPRCERCGSLRSEDDATMHRRWCGNCDLQWIEEQICAPLVARLGRRGARKALRALVRGEIG